MTSLFQNENEDEMKMQMLDEMQIQKCGFWAKTRLHIDFIHGFIKLYNFKKLHYNII